jgi:hypothetical protein
LYFLLFINVINLSSINEKGVDPSSYAKSLLVNMIQANDLKGNTPSNVTREPTFIRWWLLFVHKKAASIPNIQIRSFHNHALYHAFSYTSMHASADLET